MKYTASVNVPGYLPESDPVVFDTPADAWEYLIGECERVEEMDMPTIDSLRAAVTLGAPDVVYGPTPGSDSPHDLGLAYCVTEVTDAEAADIEEHQD